MSVPEKKVRFSSLKKHIREIRQELKKVVWPTWPQLVQNTLTVLFACLLIGSAIWIFDLACGSLFTWVFGQ